MPAVALLYLITVMLPTLGHDRIGLRNERELRTLAEIIDAMVTGRLAHALDLAVQRYKAIETSCTDSTWAVAKHLELIPPHDISATSFAEREQASKLELREKKLREQLVRRPPAAAGGAAR